MSHISDSRDPNGIGIIPLQDHSFPKTAGMSLDKRAGLLAIRIDERPTSVGSLGHYKIDPETPGDLNGGMVWPPSTREIPGWAFAWPSIHAAGIGTAKGLTLQGTPGAGISDKVWRAGIGTPTHPKPFQNGGALEYPGPWHQPPNLERAGLAGPRHRGPFSDSTAQQLQRINSGQNQNRSVLAAPVTYPVGDASMFPDRRYAGVVEAHPNDSGTFTWPKLPLGFYGITLAATDEARQIGMFMPTDPRHVAVNHAGDYDCGTLVVDLDRQSGVDLKRMAKLQSMQWVLKEPKAIGGGGIFDGKKNTIAWNIGGSQQGDSAGGFVIDGPDDRATAANAVGHVSHFFGGPLITGPSVPDKRDIHVLGKDADGNWLYSAHLSTRSLFRVPGGPKDAHLHFRENEPWEDPVHDPPHWQQVYLRLRPDVPHNWITGKLPTIWDWETKTFLYEPEHVPPTDTPRGVPTDTPRGVPTDTPRRPGGIPVEVPRGAPVPAPGTVETPRVFERGGFRGEGDGTAPHVQQRGISSIKDRIAASTTVTAFPAVLFRPQAIGSSQVDLRGFMSPSRAQVRRFDQTAPVTLRMEGFSAQQGGGGDTGEIPGPYTENPCTGRFPGGTASGGVILLPPEVDMADWIDNFTPPQRSISTSYFIAGPGVSLAAAARLDLANGRPALGYSWASDVAGNLLLRNHGGQPDPNDTSPDDAFRMGIVSQNPAWRSQTDFWGTFDHAITSDRTWTFQDGDGTVAFLSDIPPVGVGGSGTIGTIPLWVDDGGEPGTTQIGNSLITQSGTTISITGSASITANLTIPVTTGATVGVILSGANRYIHNYGTGNFFAGILAGNFTLSSLYNVGVGDNVLSGSTTGSRNVAVGYDALRFNTSGTNNAVVGYSALTANTVGHSNVAIGINALSVNVGGVRNTAVGTDALFSNISGNQSVAIGNQAGYYETASNSIYVHNGLGVSSLATGKSNSLIYGTFNATAASQTLRINGFVGILKDPSVALDILGDGDFSATLRCQTLRADGDAGGVASTVGLTNLVSGVSGGGSGTVKMNGVTSRNSVGWIKVYNGTTAVYIPFWDTITG